MDFFEFLHNIGMVLRIVFYLSCIGLLFVFLHDDYIGILASIVLSALLIIVFWGFETRARGYRDGKDD